MKAQRAKPNLALPACYQLCYGCRQRLCRSEAAATDLENSSSSYEPVLVWAGRHKAVFKLHRPHTAARNDAGTEAPLAQALFSLHDPSVSSQNHKAQDDTQSTASYRERQLVHFSERKNSPKMSSGDFGTRGVCAPSPTRLKKTSILQAPAS